MLKIEVIKFEAQDVITASVAAPVTPTNPAAPVHTDRCANGNHHNVSIPGHPDYDPSSLYYGKVWGTSDWEPCDCDCH